MEHKQRRNVMNDELTAQVKNTLQEIIERAEAQRKVGDSYFTLGFHGNVLQDVRSLFAKIVEEENTQIENPKYRVYLFSTYEYYMKCRNFSIHTKKSLSFVYNAFAKDKDEAEAQAMECFVKSYPDITVWLVEAIH